jgi:hypothetical protein
MNLLAVDPGTTQSAYVIWDGENILEFGILPNSEFLNMVYLSASDSSKVIEIGVIEKITSYGMAVGEAVFETVFFSGRLHEVMDKAGIKPMRMARHEVKMHLCHNMRAKDSNISQALVDRFAPLTPNHGKGRKAEPGFFYGFKADIWQAMALACTYYDIHMKSSGNARKDV